MPAEDLNIFTTNYQRLLAEGFALKAQGKLSDAQNKFLAAKEQMQQYQRIWVMQQKKESWSSWALGTTCTFAELRIVEASLAAVDCLLELGDCLQAKKVLAELNTSFMQSDPVLKAQIQSAKDKLLNTGLRAILDALKLLHAIDGISAQSGRALFDSIEQATKWTAMRADINLMALRNLALPNNMASASDLQECDQAFAKYQKLLDPVDANLAQAVADKLKELRQNLRPKL